MFFSLPVHQGLKGHEFNLGKDCRCGAYTETLLVTKVEGEGENEDIKVPYILFIPCVALFVVIGPLRYVTSF